MFTCTNVPRRVKEGGAKGIRRGVGDSNLWYHLDMQRCQGKHIHGVGFTTTSLDCAKKHG